MADIVTIGSNKYIHNRLDAQTGENITYIKTTKWWDGTAMDDTKVDGTIYVKHTASGEYYKRAYTRYIDARWIGLKADYDTTKTNNTPILQAFIDKLPVGISLAIFFPAGKYYFADTVNVIDKPLYWIGESTIPYAPGETKFFFPVGAGTGATGINWGRSNNPTAKENGTLENITVESEGLNWTDLNTLIGLDLNNPTAVATAMSNLTHIGINISGCTRLINCRAISFSIGFKAAAAIDTGGNASFSRYDRCYGSNGGVGFAAFGPDSNKITYMDCDARNNTHYGFLDSSFLGCTYISCGGHANLQGHFKSTNSQARVVILAPYGEGDGSAPSDISASPYGIYFQGIGENNVNGLRMQGMYNTGEWYFRKQDTNGQYNMVGFKDGTLRIVSSENVPFRLRNLVAGKTLWSLDCLDNDFEQTRLFDMVGTHSIFTTPIYAAGGTALNGLHDRYLRHAGVGGRYWYNLTILHTATFDDLATQYDPVYNNKFCYHEGDVIENKNYNGHNVEYWKCVEAGTIGALTEVLTASSAGGTTVAITGNPWELQVGMVIKFNAISGYYKIIGFGSGGTDKNHPILHADPGVIAGGTAVSFSLPTMKACGNASGTTAQRPTSKMLIAHTSNDGFSYYDTDLDTTIYWDEVLDDWVVPSTSGGSGSIVIVEDSNYTVASGVTDVILSTSTAARTFTLPDPTTNENRKITIRHGGGAFNINFSENIRTNSSTVSNSLGQGLWITIMSDGAEWWKVNNG